MRFSEIVGYPLEYFLYQEYKLPDDFSLRHEVRRLAQEVTRLAYKVAEEHGEYFATDEQALEHLRRAHDLSDETVEAIRRLIDEQNKHKK